MSIVSQTICVGAAALTGILPVVLPEPETSQSVPAAVSLGIAQPATLGGTTCKQIGQVRKTSSGSFRCTAIGTRKSWQLVRNSSVISTTTTAAPLHTDPTISGAESLLDLSACQIQDASSESVMSSGFPRPNWLRSGRGQVNVLVIPVSFADLPFTTREVPVLRQLYEQVNQYFLRMSYGRASVRTTLAPESTWVTLDGTLEQNQLINSPPQFDASGIFRKAVEIYLRDASADGYDVVSVVSAYSLQLYIGQALSADASKYGTSQNFSGVLMLGGTVNSWEVIAHELGHAWLGYEDLYLFGGGARPFRDWDLMSKEGTDLSGWSRFLAGWMDPEWMRCAKPGVRSRHFLSLLNSDSRVDQPRVLVIALSSYASLVVEVRDTGSPCVLVYRVDTSIPHGQGPIRAIGEARQAGVDISSDSFRLSVIGIQRDGAIIEVVSTGS
jgi:M6 family metalloprotease-like protein